MVNVIRTFSKYLGDCLILLAECEAVRQAPMLAANMPIPRLLIHSDSMIAVSGVNGKVAIPKDIINIVKDIRPILLSFKEYRVDYCSKNLNTEADVISKKALSM